MSSKSCSWISGRADVRVVRRHDATHFRQLVLEWADGRRLLVRLDHGLSFLRAVGHVQHRFGDTPAKQVAAIRKLSFLAKQGTGSVVPLYVQGP